MIHTNKKRNFKGTLRKVCELRIFCVFLILISLCSFSSLVIATDNIAQGISYHGRIIKPDGSPLENQNVSFTVKILSPAPSSCVLYEEQQSLDMSNSHGVFSISIGQGTRTANDKGLSFKKIFANTGLPISGIFCASGSSYTPVAGDTRYIQVYFTDGTDTVDLGLMAIRSHPYAFQTEQIAGLGKDDLLQVNSSGSNHLSQANLEAVFQNFTELMKLIGGTSTQYTKSNQLAGSNLPTIGNGQSFKWDTSLNSGAGGWAAFTPGSATAVTVVSGTAPIVSSGGFTPTISLSTSGVTAATYGSATQSAQFTVDTFGRITAASNQTVTPDWTNVANKPATFSPSVHGHYYGDILNNAGAYLSYKPNNTACADQEILRWNNAQSRWECGTASSGSVTAVSATSPLASTGGGTPQISIQVANTTQGGYLTSADWNTFNNKQAAGNYITALTGDVTATGPGSVAGTVAKIQGQAVDSTAPSADGQVLRWNLGSSKYIATKLSNSDITGLGDAATKNVGTAAGTVAAGDDSRFTDSRAPSGSAGGDLTGTYPNPTLTTTGVAANTYTKVTVDTKGRVTSATNLGSADIPAPAGDVTGTYSATSVSKLQGKSMDTVTLSGLNNTTDSNKVLTWNGTWWSAGFVDWANLTGKPANLATVPAAGVVKSNGTVLSSSNVDLASEVTGVLPVANGGTGTATGSITGTGALTFAAGGVDQNVTLTPSGTGYTVLNGKVGIGTTTPGYLLDVHSASSGYIANFAGPNPTNVQIYQDSSVSWIGGSYNATAYDFFIRGGPYSGSAVKFGHVGNIDIATAGGTNQGIALIPNGTGGVGINSISARGVLDVVATPITTITSGIDSAVTSISVASNSFPSTGTLIVDSEQMTYSGGGTTTLNVTRGANSTTAASHLNNAKVSYYGASSFLVSSSGNVGIGTTSPGQKLEVNGSIKMTDGNQGAGKVLTSDANGVASWQTPAAAGVTSVTASSPLSSTGGTTPQISIQVANGSQNGYLSSGDWTTFNNKLGTASSFSGDVSGTSSTTSVDKLKGTALSIASLTSGDFLKYDGTNWVNSVINQANVSGLTTALGNKIDQSQISGTCDAGKTLTFISVTGTWTCSNISINDSQLSYTTSRAANTFLAAPDGSAGAASFRGIASADLPSLDTSKITSGQLAVANGGTGTATGSITGTGALTFAAGGTDQNVTLTPSGTGATLLGSKVGIGVSSTTQNIEVTGSSENWIGRDTTSTTGVIGNLRLRLSSSGTVQNGLANAIVFNMENAAGGESASIGSLSYIWEDATTEQSAFRIGAKPGGGAAGEKMRVSGSGNVGIGTTTPTAKLHVSGAISSVTNIINSGATVDLALANVHLLKAPGGSAITLQNLVSGASYTLVVSDTTSRTYTFSGCTNTYFNPTNGNTSGQSTYTILVVVDGANTNCYVAWMTGFI